MININLIKDDFIYYLTNENGFFRRKIGIGELAAPFDPLGVFTYAGTKLIRLAARQKDDPRWLTEKQCNDAGYSIKPGVTGVKIKDTVITPSGEQKRMIFDVYNAADIKGIDPFKQPGADRTQLLDNIKNLISRRKTKFAITDSYKGSRKFIQLGNSIYRPANSDHMQPDEYNATVVYEMAKATSRQIDKTCNDSIRYPMAVFSATIASYMLAAKTGMSAHPLTDKEEIGMITKMIEKKPNHIYRACLLASYVECLLKNEFRNYAVTAQSTMENMRQHNRDTGGFEY